MNVSFQQSPSLLLTTAYGSCFYRSWSLTPLSAEPSGCPLGLSFWRILQKNLDHPHMLFSPSISASNGSDFKVTIAVFGGWVASPEVERADKAHVIHLHWFSDTFCLWLWHPALVFQYLVHPVPQSLAILNLKLCAITFSWYLLSQNSKKMTTPWFKGWLCQSCLPASHDKSNWDIQLRLASCKGCRLPPLPGVTASRTVGPPIRHRGSWRVVARAVVSYPRIPGTPCMCVSTTGRGLALW